MRTATIQVLGKEAQALRKRPPEQAQDRIAIPATLNGQIASGEVNTYRFAARKGQRLLFSTQARQLIPYIADAVPGWFQPVMVLSDANGKEVAYNDDYRFKPDPTIFYEVPKDGEYALSDAARASKSCGSVNPIPNRPPTRSTSRLETWPAR